MYLTAWRRSFYFFLVLLTLFCSLPSHRLVVAAVPRTQTEEVTNPLPPDRDRRNRRDRRNAAASSLPPVATPSPHPSSRFEPKLDYDRERELIQGSGYYHSSADEILNQPFSTHDALSRTNRYSSPTTHLRHQQQEAGNSFNSNENVLPTLFEETLRYTSLYNNTNVGIADPRHDRDLQSGYSVPVFMPSNKYSSSLPPTHSAAPIATRFQSDVAQENGQPQQPLNRRASQRRQKQMSNASRRAPTPPPAAAPRYPARSSSPRAMSSRARRKMRYQPKN